MHVAARIIPAVTFAIVAAFCTSASFAEEIANGVTVKPERLALPVNEQPYFGFVSKPVEMKAADEKMISAVQAQGYTRQQAANHAAQRGWEAINKGDWSTASKRFNQASLFEPAMSQIAHGFAIIVTERDRVPNYAVELFKAAAQLKDPLPSLPADHARVLLMSGRPAEAIPLLQKAIAQTPAWAVPYSNLANAYFDMGKTAEACAALKKIPANNNPNVQNDTRRIIQLAKCQ